MCTSAQPLDGADSVTRGLDAAWEAAEAALADWTALRRYRPRQWTLTLVREGDYFYARAAIWHQQALAPDTALMALTADLRAAIAEVKQVNPLGLTPRQNEISEEHWGELCKDLDREPTMAELVDYLRMRALEEDGFDGRLPDPDLAVELRATAEALEANQDA